MITRKSIFLLIIFSLLLLFPIHVFAQNQIPFSVFSSGGKPQTNATYTINGSLGQTISGKNQSSNHQALVGFWQIYYQDVIVDVEDERMMPIEFKLEQNYPNPFNPTTTISFSIPSQSFVSLKIYDALGREVSVLLSEELSAGTYSKQWNVTGLASGVYFCFLHAGSFTETKKLILLR